MIFLLILISVVVIIQLILIQDRVINFSLHQLRAPSYTVSLSILVHTSQSSWKGGGRTIDLLYYLNITHKYVVIIAYGSIG
jgi:hypothetical protein